MQVISTTALHNYKVPVIIKKLKNFTFCLGKSRENFINIFQDFPGLTNKIQRLSRTFQDSKKNPGLFQDVATPMALPSAKTLGSVWVTESDELRIQCSLKPLSKYTRRTMLSQLGQNF